MRSRGSGCFRLCQGFSSPSLLSLPEGDTLQRCRVPTHIGSEKTGNRFALKGSGYRESRAAGSLRVPRPKVLLLRGEQSPEGLRDFPRVTQLPACAVLVLPGPSLGCDPCTPGRDSASLLANISVSPFLWFVTQGRLAWVTSRRCCGKTFSVRPHLDLMLETPGTFPLYDRKNENANGLVV